MVNDHWVRPDLVSHEWSAWCKPYVRRPALGRSASVEVNPPSVGHASRNVSVDGVIDGMIQEISLMTF